MMRLLGLGLALTICAALLGAQEPVIFIRDLDGPVSLRALDGKEITLTRKDHMGRRLHVGEAVQCRAGGKLVVQFEDGQPQTLAPSAIWVTILWRPTAAQSAQQTRNAAAAKNYGRAGASEKGVRSIVFVPAGASVLRPSAFRIAWTKSQVARRVSLAITDEDGNELWRQNGIAGAAGSVESKAARDALLKYRQSGASGSLTLTLDQGGGRLTEVFFSLLPQAAERELDQELKEWDLPATDLMRYLGRAAVFAQRRMPNDEALELESALEQAPGSTDLMLRTIVAERRIGNVDRARELERKLPAGARIPE